VVGTGGNGSAEKTGGSVVETGGSKGKIGGAHPMRTFLFFPQFYAIVDKTICCVFGFLVIWKNRFVFSAFLTCC